MNTKKLLKLTLFACSVSTVGLTLAPGTLQADTVAYAQSAGGFGTIDLNTGIFTKTLQINGINDGLGVYNGNLYGAGFADTLYQINPSTGAVTALNTNTNLNADGFGSTTAGLFGAVAGNPANLYSFDPITGAPTLIGSTGIQGLAGTGALSVSNDSSTLYWTVQTSPSSSTDSLYRINTSTGAATLIGTNVTVGGLSAVDALLFEGGTLWAEFGNNTGPTIATIDMTTGAATLLSIEQDANGGQLNFSGLAPDPLSPTAPPPPPATTPEPATCALFGVSLGAFGLLRRFCTK